MTQEETEARIKRLENLVGSILNTELPDILNSGQQEKEEEK